MKYIKNKDNFDLFVKNWNIENEYVLFGASKECVQFIRTMDYLLGPDKLKIKYVVDHETSQVGVYDNILELSSFYYYSNEINNFRSNIEVKHLDEYVMTTAENSVSILNSAITEMERRFEIFSNVRVRNLDEYNQKKSSDSSLEKIPHLVVVIDELADLMMTSGRAIEEPITRLAQKARAVGLHLIVATQRPSVDVITGLIKSNFPARIAFQVSSKIDSRTIIDQMGAEKLLGKGDMLFLLPGTTSPIRIHNAYVTLEEIEKIPNMNVKDYFLLINEIGKLKTNKPKLQEFMTLQDLSNLQHDYEEKIERGSFVFKLSYKQKPIGDCRTEKYQTVCYNIDLEELRIRSIKSILFFVSF